MIPQMLSLPKVMVPQVITLPKVMVPLVLMLPKVLVPQVLALPKVMASQVIRLPKVMVPSVFTLLHVLTLPQGHLRELPVADNSAKSHLNWKIEVLEVNKDSFNFKVGSSQSVFIPVSRSPNRTHMLIIRVQSTSYRLLCQTNHADRLKRINRTAFHPPSHHPSIRIKGLDMWVLRFRT
ncbi:hypothetical protein CDAR_270191 [Caerostris darwini]|uniref:Uncharacterized protein n=1 Tax=Caerostris darwini TaxID=1538125 RepID=A0AAV4ULC3_9ARAC|nr:hypothetical protein CDAR_270191 [Caerostris darwini]